MADTTFSPGTIITSDWLNDVNDMVYDGVTASSVVVTPAGTISSTDAQAALEELDGDIQTKAASTHNHTGTYEPVITTLSIAKGGTGQATATAAFDALAPTTTAGDMIYHNGTDNVRLAKGTAGQVLTMNSGATAPEWATSGSLLGIYGKFTAGSETATRPVGATKALIRVQGGGGTGGTDSGTGAGGGGSGAFAEAFKTVSGDLTVTVGGAATASSVAGSGFTTITAAGGGNGSGATAGTGGALPTTGDINIAGQNGLAGGQGGRGGGGLYAVGGAGMTASAGQAGLYGGGGGGVGSGGWSPGAGGAGFVTIYWYA